MFSDNWKTDSRRNFIREDNLTVRKSFFAIFENFSEKFWTCIFNGIDYFEFFTKFGQLFLKKENFYTKTEWLSETSKFWTWQWHWVLQGNNITVLLNMIEIEAAKSKNLKLEKINFYHFWKKSVFDRIFRLSGSENMGNEVLAAHFGRKLTELDFNGKKYRGSLNKVKNSMSPYDTRSGLVGWGHSVGHPDTARYCFPRLELFLKNFQNFRT